MDHGPLFEMLRRFASTMAHGFEVSEVLYELGDSAVTILDAAGAGVSVASDGRLEFATATDESVIAIEEVQQRHQEGPCVESFTTGQIVAVPDISLLDRWRPYQETAAASGWRSVVGLPLVLGDFRVGSLSVYDRRVRDWSKDDLAAAAVIADVATAHLVRAGELAEAHQLTRQLQIALDSRIVTEQAKGMLSRDHEISVDAAFELLRVHSRTRNVPLRRIVEQVVHDGLRLEPADGSDPPTEAT